MPETEITYVGTAPFVAKRNENGDLIVVGKATGPDLDLDQQICDPDWLAKEMPTWFRTGANVREQHSNIAAGIGLEIEQNGADWYLKSEVVDPVTAKKVEKKVLSGYSIGIKNAKIIKDAAAPNGRIVGGQIVEISLVDRPANPTARIEIAKAVDGGTLELVKSDGMERHAGAKDSDDLYPAALPCPACNGLGKLPAEVEGAAKTCELCNGSGHRPEELEAEDDRFGNPVHTDNHEIKSTEANVPVVEEAPIVDEGDAVSNEEALPVGEAKSLQPNTVIADAFAYIQDRAAALGRADLSVENTKAVEHDAATLNAVRSGLIALIKAELDEMQNGSEDETEDVAYLLSALRTFLCWWDCEADEGETVEPFMDEEQEEGMDTMAYVGLGVSADIIKAAAAADATDEQKNSLRTEMLKALGVADELTITKSMLQEQEETVKSLKAELEAVKEMAVPGGPALRQNAVQATKANDAERLSAEAERMRFIASELTNPEYKARYLAKAQQLDADAKAMLRI